VSVIRLVVRPAGGNTGLIGIADLLDVARGMVNAQRDAAEEHVPRE